MARTPIRTICLGLAALAATALSVPVAAQMYSEGYQFLQAVKDREGDEATEMLSQPGTTLVNTRDVTSGETGLHITVDRRDLTWTKFLLQKGANPNIADNRGRTPLIAAAQIGWVEGVQALVDAGARMDIGNETGETPLISAVHSRNIEMIEVLVKAGADPDRADNAGRTARDYAAMPGVSGRVLSAIERSEASAEENETRTYGPVF